MLELFTSHPTYHQFSSPVTSQLSCCLPAFHTSSSSSSGLLKLELFPMVKWSSLLSGAPWELELYFFYQALFSSYLHLSSYSPFLNSSSVLQQWNSPSARFGTPALALPQFWPSYLVLNFPQLPWLLRNSHSNFRQSPILQSTLRIHPYGFTLLFHFFFQLHPSNYLLLVSLLSLKSVLYLSLDSSSDGR